MVFFPLKLSVLQTVVPKNKTDSSIKNRVLSSFTGDLAELKKRRIIRVLVSYNKTNFFTTPKGFRGVEHDLLKAYEAYLNSGPKKQRYPTHLMFIPMTFGEIIEKLSNGYGDIAASGLTVTPKRAELVDFTEPYLTNINEILVSHSHSKKIDNLKDLSGKQVIVVANSSYLTHLKTINTLIENAGYKTIKIIIADKELEAEDLLKMVNEGIHDYTIVDNHLALIWQDVLKNIVLSPKIIFSKSTNIAWATQKNLPQLKASLNSFIKKHAKQGRLLGNSVYKRYFKDSYWLKKPLTHDLLDKVDCLQYYFEYYGEFYDIDWQLIAAQAYQESHFSQHKKSSAGAIGIMQVKPSTAKGKHINIPNIKNIKNNIHAGIKYLSFLKERYFSGRKYNKEEQTNFALAAYNAGPAKILKLQKIAKERGLNPYIWFYHVETIAREKIGLETVNYVANIQKMKLFLQASNKLKQDKLDVFTDKTLQKKAP
jgi:membrane-bound lytic murein transglycosylase MltF